MDGSSSPRGQIDFIASRPHYADHLVPVWWALPEEVRGVFYAPSNLHEYLGRYRILAKLGYDPGSVLVAAGFRDIRGTRHRHTALMEHGVGQTYGNPSPSYADGEGRTKATLILAPNERVASFAPKKSVVIGTPFMDEFFLRPPTRRLEDPVAFAFHWRCSVENEAGTAFDEYKSAVEDVAFSGLKIVGHGHPKMMKELTPFYRDRDIPVWQHFSHVMQRARLLVCDNSSVIYYFAALGKPVILLNASWWRRDVEWGLRFWDQADVGLQVDQPSDLLHVILRGLEDNHDVRSRREEISREVVPIQDGTATRRAVEAILGLL